MFPTQIGIFKCQTAGVGEFHFDFVGHRLIDVAGHTKPKTAETSRVPRLFQGIAGFQEVRQWRFIGEAPVVVMDAPRPLLSDRFGFGLG